jgi:hypothetical protein
METGAAAGPVAMRHPAVMTMPAAWSVVAFGWAVEIA